MRRAITDENKPPKAASAPSTSTRPRAGHALRISQRAGGAGGGTKLHVSSTGLGVKENNPLKENHPPKEVREDKGKGKREGVKEGKERPTPRRALSTVSQSTCTASASTTTEKDIRKPRPISRPGRSITPARPLPLPPKTPHTPPNQIGINPLKRAIPTTFDRPTASSRKPVVDRDSGKKKRRIEVLDEQVEYAVPTTEPPFRPLTPAQSAIGAAIQADLERDIPLPPPEPTIAAIKRPLPRIPGFAVDLPDLDMPELDFEIELPDLDFVI